MTIKILHLIESISSGGASRNTLSIAQYSAQLDKMYHSIVSLSPASVDGKLLAAKYGVPIKVFTNVEDLVRNIENSDIVQLSYWNCPQVNRILNLQLPPMRLAIWFRIFGAVPPQIITSTLINYADLAVMTSPGSLSLPESQYKSNERKDGDFVVPGPADFERVKNIRFKDRNTFNVGYIGTVDFVKMHPNFIEMNSMIDIPNIRIIVCGRGAIDDGTEQILRQKAIDLGKAHIFDFRGYVDDIQTVIGEFDVFGYPLCKETFATSEAILQEIMYAGIPPVVFPYGGVKNLIINYETGIIVHNEHEYSAAIRYLFNHPDKRKIIGENASKFAKKYFGGENAAAAMNKVYLRMMELTKKPHLPILNTTNRDLNFKNIIKRYNVYSGSPIIGASLFVMALGRFGKPFYRSLFSDNEYDLTAAENEISYWAKSFLMTSNGYGSVFHYRNAFPEDPYLHFWCGLILLRQNKFEEAVKEFSASLSFGYSPQRIHKYITLAINKGNTI